MAIVVQNLVLSRFCEAMERKPWAARAWSPASHLSVAETERQRPGPGLAGCLGNKVASDEVGGGAVTSRKRILVPLPPPPPLPSQAVVVKGGRPAGRLAWLAFLPWRLPQSWAVRLSVGGDVIWVERWGYARGGEGWLGSYFEYV